MNWTTQLLKTIEAGTFLFLCHFLSSFPLSYFPIWCLYPLSEYRGFPCAANLVTQYTGSQKLQSLGRGRWVWIEKDKGKQARQQLSLVWQVSPKFRPNSKGTDSSIYSFIHSKWEQGKGTTLKGEMIGMLSCVIERVSSCNKTRKAWTVSGLWETDCFGHIPSPSQ